MPILPGNLTGTHYVRVIRPAFQDARRMLPQMRDRAVLRRHALKLRFWGADEPVDDQNQVVDLDWGWIKALRNERIGELRIDDHIGGFNNIRIITWHPERSLTVDWDKRVGPVPHVWVLSAFQKKRQDFTKGEYANFRARRQTVIERFYGSLL